MKAPRFLYRRPDTLEEALALLADNAGEAQVLAGGQSLMPTLNMRLSSPGMLVDINRITGLQGIAERGDAIHIGALVRHREVADSDVIARSAPLVASAMTHVAHMAVRNRGTTCGSLALADPSAEMPAVALLLNATIHLDSKAGTRDVAARAFFQGLYATDRAEDEMIVGVSFPCASVDERFHFQELSRRHGDFAIVGIGVKGRLRSGRIEDVEAVIFGSEPAPLLSSITSGMSIEPDTPDAALREMAHAIAAEMDPIANHQGRPETKRRQAAELLQRAFADMRTVADV
jgi:carbon-monoxide dehydrogenase medium subunit